MNTWMMANAPSSLEPSTEHIPLVHVADLSDKVPYVITRSDTEAALLGPTRTLSILFSTNPLLIYISSPWRSLSHACLRFLLQIMNSIKSFSHSPTNGFWFSVSLCLLLVSPFSKAQTSPEQTDPYANMRFSPSMAIIIVVLIAALFFMGFFSIYIRHCSTDASGASVRPAAGGQRSRRALARGLEPSVIETFPTLVYSEVKTLKIGKGALECAVCLNEFEDDETLRLIPKCDHVFHPECIDAWLSSHTTCPVCRANLVPQPGEPIPRIGELHPELDLEAQNRDQNDVVAPEPEDLSRHGETQAPEPQVLGLDIINRTLNRTRTRGSRSGRPRKFPRSHSTGHSLVQPGENTERFTLRLPVDVRKQIMNRELNRSNSLVVLPRESSSRRGYRAGGEGSSRGRNSRWLDRMDRSFKSERWVFSMAPPFFSRAPSLRSTKVAANDDNAARLHPLGPEESSAQPVRPAV